MASPKATSSSPPRPISCSGTNCATRIVSARCCSSRREEAPLLPYSRHAENQLEPPHAGCYTLSSPLRPSRFDNKKAYQHQRKKHAIPNRKHALVRIIKNQPMEPVLHEGSMISRVKTRFHAQLVLPRSQRTNCSHHALSRNERDQRQVRHAKPEIPRETPSSQIPEPNRRQSSQVKEHN